MESLREVVDFYKKNIEPLRKHKAIYEQFHVNAHRNSALHKHFSVTQGFGELPFSWSWYLLVNDLPTKFKFLEIGVYKGRVLSLVKLISDMLKKEATIFGITPLNTSGDKYSEYDTVDFLNEIKLSYSKSNLSFDSTQIIKGYSQNDEVIEKANENKEYDMIFIDGCHDYEVVCLDIYNYGKMLKVGGYLILDDASSLLNGAHGRFLGHDDVGTAVKDFLENDSQFVHLYAVGHNRVWKKV
jgi:hypothetical protein